MKATPPPWHAVRIDNQHWQIDAPDGDPTLNHQSWCGMVDIWGCDDFPAKGEEVVEANAYLIQSAWELYQELADRYAQTRCGCSHSACKRCKDDASTELALAHARGERLEERCYNEILSIPRLQPSRPCADRRKARDYRHMRESEKPACR